MNIKCARINGLELSVCGYAELPDFATHGITHVVSLWDGYHAEDPQPRLFLETVFPAARLHFGFFNDIFAPGAYAPHIGAIRDILEFTAELKTGDYLLVHCAVGISRSTAITFAALCQHAGPGLEPDCLRALKRIRPSAAPNPLIVELADALLRRNGTMIHALKRT